MGESWRPVDLTNVKPRLAEQPMECPDCGRLCKPYGGFGVAMPTTGKYGCEPWAGDGPGCGTGWYGKPSSREIVTRW